VKVLWIIFTLKAEESYEMWNTPLKWNTAVLEKHNVTKLLWTIRYTLGWSDFKMQWWWLNSVL